MKKMIIVALAILIFFTYNQAVNSKYSNPDLVPDLFRGLSGKLKVILCTPNTPVLSKTLPGLRFHCETESGSPVVSEEGGAPTKPGIYKFSVELSQKIFSIFEDLRLITLIPFSAKKNGRIGNYILGNWPYEVRTLVPLSPAYANPPGFIEVTRENSNLYVSEHFKLGDFLTKDQPNVWPKYMLLSSSLIDKLELIIDELEREGCDVKHMTVMSGFRTPRYNKTGGDTGGRGKLSRHMYGDAADIFVDNDRDGWTDDITGDGRVDIHDAKLLAKVAERIETHYPTLVGGLGIYPARNGHGPFIHVDVRGRKARWGEI